MKNKTKLEELKELESSHKEEIKKETEFIGSEMILPKNDYDHYVFLDRHDLPQRGLLYPESWQFSYRCPSTKEVTQFSALQDNDYVGALQAMEELIKNCILIFDENSKKQISAKEICDAHRIFFLLLLRDIYLHANPIVYPAICPSCGNVTDVKLTHKSLVFEELSENLLNSYDGRVFCLERGDVTIRFRIPTIETSSKVIRFISKARKDNNDGKKNHQEFKISTDKLFISILPYLYEEGNEPINSLYTKFNKIKNNKDETILKIYLEIFTKLKLDHKENILFECNSDCGYEETALTFQGGWKEFFDNRNELFSPSIPKKSIK